MNTENREPSVYGRMQTVLAFMSSPQEQKNLAGDLASIRNSVGKGYEEAAEVWPILFPLIPDQYLGSGALTAGEKALLVTLQLYAVGQQGSNKVRNDESRSFGSSLQKVRNEGATAMDRRFNTMLTATTYEEFTYYLRQLFKIGKAKDGFSVNFPALAEDLFWYQNGRDKTICLKWARDYYRSYQSRESDSAESSVAE